MIMEQATVDWCVAGVNHHDDHGERWPQWKLWSAVFVSSENQNENTRSAGRRTQNYDPVRQGLMFGPDYGMPQSNHRSVLDGHTFMEKYEVRYQLIGRAGWLVEVSFGAPGEERKAASANERGVRVVEGKSMVSSADCAAKNSREKSYEKQKVWEKAHFSLLIHPLKGPCVKGNV